jgi:hypothetical protein
VAAGCWASSGAENPSVRTTKAASEEWIKFMVFNFSFGLWFLGELAGEAV